MGKYTQEQFDAFVDHYMAGAFSLDIARQHPKAQWSEMAKSRIRLDCREFLCRAARYIPADKPDCYHWAGRDFWHSRNRLGTGFNSDTVAALYETVPFHEMTEPFTNRTALEALSQEFGRMSVFVDEKDGLIHVLPDEDLPEGFDGKD